MGDAILLVQSKERNGEYRPVEDGDRVKTGGKVPKLDHLGAFAAGGTTGILDTLLADADANDFTILAQPDKPRNLAIAFADDWDGGDVVLEYINQFDELVTETVVAVMDTTVVSKGAIKQLISARKTAVGAQTVGATAGLGVKLGLSGQPYTPEGLFFAKPDGQLDAAIFNEEYATVEAPGVPATPVIGNVTHDPSDGNSVLTVTGAPVLDAEVEVEIVVGGTNPAAETATIKVSLDGGENFGSTVPLPASGVYVIPDTGLTLTFSAASLVAEDVYAFTVSKARAYMALYNQ